MRQAYFLTGTDLEVGKSLIATGFLYTAAQSWDMRVLGMKPVVAGPGNDIERLVAASNVEAPRHYINPYKFDEPVAPNIAAKGVEQTIDLGHIKYCFDEVRGRADLVIVEDVSLHVDVVTGCVDCGDHRPVGGRAILQKAHFVAGRQRAADDGLLHRQVAIEQVSLPATPFQAFDRGLALCSRQGSARTFELHRRPGLTHQVRRNRRQTAARAQGECQAKGQAGPPERVRSHRCTVPRAFQDRRVTSVP